MRTAILADEGNSNIVDIQIYSTVLILRGNSLIWLVHVDNLSCSRASLILYFSDMTMFSISSAPFIRGLVLV